MKGETTMFLDDLTPGRRFAFPETVTVTEEAIIAFARQFDPQPFHTDPVAAKSSMFGGLAASGWHTAGLTMSVLVRHFLLDDGIVGLGAELQWPRPTRPGDVLSVATEVLEARPSRSNPAQGLAKLRTTTTNANGEVVQVFTGTVVVPVRPATHG